ncbi:MAG TPA: hypothetical protein VM260_01520 [Pirellula sp.]|nr:hypothetical protein [Pirellula sp.]
MLNEPGKDLSVLLAKVSIRRSPSVASLDYKVVEDSQHAKLFAARIRADHDDAMKVVHCDLPHTNSIAGQLCAVHARDSLE